MPTIGGIAGLLASASSSPMQSILQLIILFVCTSIALYTGGLTLMGILYLLIYVGAIAILFLFLLSLVGGDDLLQREDNFSHKGRHLALLALILLLCLSPLEMLTIDYDITNIIIETPVNEGAYFGELHAVGNQLYTDYAPLLIIIGIILLLSVIGAIAMTR
uniref:NADH-ubiquinone oxidoreductase chain 6 n=1 Tax=Candida buenavistaensis TaxID=434039 RepID=S5TMM0_9ASCO|nr:NADH dehydrogenase subunit 6 [Candida buenavistaensis]AGS44070.1 NADH dehydrogenase subunit 6 [Candida buenavistaensis]